MSEQLTTVEIVISRVINEDGKMSVQIKTPTDYNSLEILGLLETARWHIYNSMNNR